jgi:hypothetical protein
VEDQGERVGRRGILPSLGAGTSLIVAGVLLLAVISSIIAFRGFPGLDPGVARPPVRLATPATDGTGRNAPAPIVVGVTAGSATLAAPARRPRTGSVRARADGPAVRIGGAPSTGSGSPPPAPVSDPVREPPAATPSTDQPKTTAPAPASRPVRQTVDRVRDAASAVQPPPAPAAVQPVVDEVVGTANEVVDQAAGTADDLVGSVLP